MARYSEVYESLADQAIRRGVLDLQALVDRLIIEGADDDIIDELIFDDFESGGPISRQFLTGVTSAATSATNAAVVQGQLAGQVARKYSGQDLENIYNSLANGDDDAIERFLDEEGEEKFTWVCTFVNTCHRCLPLHGVSLTTNEWKRRGVSPSTIHGDWESECKCNLVRSEDVDQQGITEPLRRVKLSAEEQAQLKAAGVRRTTTRAIASTDIETAIEYRDQAMQSEEGRRLLRKLGQLPDARTKSEGEYQP